MCFGASRELLGYYLKYTVYCFLHMREQKQLKAKIKCVYTVIRVEALLVSRLHPGSIKIMPGCRGGDQCGNELFGLGLVEGLKYKTGSLSFLFNVKKLSVL